MEPGIRIVVIGDLHASARSLVDIARRLPLTDRKLRWTAEDTLLVFTGDLCDRGYESKTLYSLVMQWQEEAPARGSEVRFVIGNHEVMATWGLSHDTTDEEHAGYGGGNLREGQAERRKAFAPGGWLYTWLLHQRFIFSKAGIIFSHGDIPGAFADWSVDDLEDYTREGFLSGETYGFSRHSLPDPLFSETGSILWCRDAQNSAPRDYRPRLERFLRENEAGLLVCGHTPSRSGRMQTRFGGRYICADTAMVFQPRGFGMDSALVIEGGRAEGWYFKPGKILKEPLDLQLNR